MTKTAMSASDKQKLVQQAMGVFTATQKRHSNINRLTGQVPQDRCCRQLDCEPDEQHHAHRPDHGSGQGQGRRVEVQLRQSCGRHPHHGRRIRSRSRRGREPVRRPPAREPGPLPAGPGRRDGRGAQPGGHLPPGQAAAAKRHGQLRGPAVAGAHGGRARLRGQHHLAHPPRSGSALQQGGGQPREGSDQETATSSWTGIRSSASR